MRFTLTVTPSVGLDGKVRQKSKNAEGKRVRRVNPDVGSQGLHFCLLILLLASVVVLLE